MDFINFKVGKNTIALKILDILLTQQYEENLTPLPNERKSFLGIKEIMRKPVPVFDLGLILNQVSSKESHQALIGMLKMAQQDLADWFYQLQQAIEEGIPFSGTRDPQPSTFDLWYDNEDADNEDMKSTRAVFETAYLQLHHFADEMLHLIKIDQKEEAHVQFIQEQRTTYVKLIRVFESLLEQIALDYKPIIVFTTQDGMSANVGFLVDKVEETVEVEEEDIQPLGDIIKTGFDIDPQTKNMMTGLIKHKNKHSLILDPSAIFLEIVEDKKEREDLKE